MLGAASPESYFGTEVFETIKKLKHFVVENEKNARRFLIQLGIESPIDDLTFYTLNKHTDLNEIHSYIKPLLQGNHMGLLSDAGCPAVADPGALIVELAHQQQITVHPLIGPSSILLGLMASGFNGQSFVFHGYLPHDNFERQKKLKSMEMAVQKDKQTQIFIETPFRNDKLIEELKKSLHPKTSLCVAVDLTLASETIISQSIANWKKTKSCFHKRAAIFLIG